MIARMEKADINHLGLLARIEVPADVQPELQTDIEAVLAYVSDISSIDLGAADTAAISGVQNVFRADEVTNEPGSYREALLREAPKTKDGFLVVPKILNPDT